MSEITLCRKCFNELKRAKEDNLFPTTVFIKKSIWKSLCKWLYRFLKEVWSIYVIFSVLILSISLMTLHYVPDGLRQIIIKY